MNRAVGAVVLLLWAVVVSSIALVAQTRVPRPSDDVRAALARISAPSMSGHVEFLSSDLLQGRSTPSPGLDIAASYIAAQFRRAGLDPVGNDGYFQTSPWVLDEQPQDGFEFRLRLGDHEVTATRKQLSYVSPRTIDLQAAPVTKIDFSVRMLPPTAEEVKGKVVLTQGPGIGGADLAARMRAFNESLWQVARLEPALIVMVSRPPFVADSAPRLSEVGGSGAARPQDLILEVNSTELQKLFPSMAADASAQMDVRAPAARRTPLQLRNVVGLLRGSDPVLQHTYVVLSAHYDHQQPRQGGQDNVFNGANDNASGTASIIEIASALATLKTKPKRSILFVAFFGEEQSMLGSDYYIRHPVVPLEKTVANVNLEQMGRTDDSDGVKLRKASVTGFDYTDMPEVFVAAGKSTGIDVYRDARKLQGQGMSLGDRLFTNSDNLSFAAAGIPAHTISVAFSFPDQHAVGDHWDKIDYTNMAAVDRMVALGTLMLADSPAEPRWKDGIDRTANYVDASRKLRSGR
jgi:hypothetical protein